MPNLSASASPFRPAFSRRTRFLLLASILLCLAMAIPARAQIPNLSAGQNPQIENNTRSINFIWTLIAVGVTALFTAVLSVRGLWSLRRGQPR